MTRTQQTVVVYPVEMALPAASLEKFELFEKWMTAELILLESRWIGSKPSRDLRTIEPVSPIPGRA